MIGKKEKNLIYAGSDHAGFEQKNKLVEFLKEKEEYKVIDLGCFSEDSCDYPIIAREVSEKVGEHLGSFGILLCGSGIGMAISANKMPGIRAVLALNENMAELSRQHNNANVLALGARDAGTSFEEMKKITDKFLSTPFEEGEERRVRRVKQIDEL